MRFSIAALLALATAVVAQTEGFNVITKPTEGEKVPAGSTYEIVWQPSDDHEGPITIGLLGGSSPQTLSVVDTIAEGVDPSTGSYSWKVPSGGEATYGIIITLESDPAVFQYGFPFKIVGGSDDDEDDSSSSSSSSVPSSTSTSTSAATSTTSDAESTSKSSTKTKTHDHSSTVTSTSVSASSSTLVSSTTTRANSSTTSIPETTVTSSVVETATSTTSSSTSLATNGVPTLGPGSFAMLGGMAMAVLAL
ncbi:Ser-Thr-rich glycosyl-phosphatidyl-inositol-anchored membrane family-domain-containing protein [Corynascus novoguineensis]|uniref:Ser-Thr-rich glycosyl-phosphatidyl-inositol-anchored membrane family-domain-containing protein n=1 Tax=Corynascus novoguineensis TaxID=1126955 RepID=A0AAN7HUA6_9PEZI|nr:Ser-Thr-rich glycosyl-phosphatidyl-inositol-anchored membrane family-domain-containing protein [Corynascus novoguineensis]